MNDAYFYLSVRMPLPCGCVLTQSYRVEGTPDSGKAVDQGAGILKYWLASREKLHACEHVSSDNPSGRSDRPLVAAV